MNSAIHALIVTDIFGVTPSTQKLAKQLSAQYQLVSIIDPYKGIQQEFTNEVMAYQSFIALCGHDAYQDLVSQCLIQALSQPNNKILLIGFSAGASAVWRAIDRDSNLAINSKINNRFLHFTGFYPSHIRHYLNMIPLCKTTFIFPRHESHFNVQTVISELSKNTYSLCIQTRFLHGFMNPSSVNYCVWVHNGLTKILTRFSIELSKELSKQPSNQLSKEHALNYQRRLISEINQVYLIQSPETSA